MGKRRLEHIKATQSDNPFNLNNIRFHIPTGKKAVFENIKGKKVVRY